MVRAAKGFETDQFRFFSDRDAAVAELRKHGGISLAYSSGTLMYLAEPYAWLKWFVGLGAEHLALVRVALHDGSADIVTIQSSRLSHNGPGPLPPGFSEAVVKYPVTSCRRPAVEELLAAEYLAELRSVDAGDCPVPEARMFGFYCRRRG
jgi:hypothetical protein